MYVYFFVGAKTSGNFFGNFNITFLATRGYASDFLKMLPQFKMAARCQLHFFLWAQKLKVRNNSHFTITLPTKLQPLPTSET